MIPVLLALSFLVFGTANAGWLFGGSSSSFEPPKHADGVDVVDLADHTLPKVRLGERVIDLMSGLHFDNLLQDTPDDMRPPSIILFEGHQSCPNADQDLSYTYLAEHQFPSRERLLIARYNMDANPKRAWFKFIPEMDLKARYGVKECGTVAFVPRVKDCDGFIDYCTQPTEDPKVQKVGCENFVDKCAQHVRLFKPNNKPAKPFESWVMDQVKEQGEPKISPVFGTYQDQRRWILDRDETTTDNEMRDYYLVEAFPAFTNLGFLPMPIPDEFNEWIMGFWQRRKAGRVTETWHAASTQMDFHDAPTSFVSMDQERRMRDKLANEIIKPIVEKWSGISPLELTSFYGIREYGNNSLRGHIDRIDTHVLSVTFSLGKLNISDYDQILTEQQVNDAEKWPLEVVAWDGNMYRHEHPPGTMILYESSKLIHGRPYHNKGPAHLGAFCHFKPVNMNKFEAQKWDEVATKAKKHQRDAGKRGTYRSTPTQEPEHPQYTDFRYGDATGFQKTGEPARQPAGFQVTFKNNHDRPLDIHWVSPQSESLVLQGSIAPGASFDVQTFVGHSFQWTEEGSKKTVPKGRFEIERGSRLYQYGSATVAEA